MTTASTRAQVASFATTSRSRRAFAAGVSEASMNGKTSSFWRVTAASHRLGAAAQDASRPRTALPIASFRFFKGSSWSWTRRALSSCAQLLRRRGSYTTWTSGNEFPEGKSPDRERESGGSKGLKLIKFHLLEDPTQFRNRLEKKRALMDQFAKETLPVSLEEEMRRSYLDYAMSVIVGRALPDVRDGLKPVHRRVLFAMHEANNVWNRPYVKCAREEHAPVH